MKTEKQDPTPKTSKRQPKTAKAVKAGAEPTQPARKAKVDTEPADRLPATVEELKASKSGLVAYLFLSGKGKDEIAAELKMAFKLPEAQAAKITRRIVGRARFFQRALSLVTAK